MRQRMVETVGRGQAVGHSLRVVSRRLALSLVPSALALCSLAPLLPQRPARAAGPSPDEPALASALEAAQPAHDFEHRAGVLTFAVRGKARQCVVVIEVPPDGAGGLRDERSHSGRFALLALVKDGQHRIVARLGDGWRAAGAVGGSASGRTAPLVFQRIVDLAPGRYTLETAVRDRATGGTSVGRSPFDVPAADRWLDTSSLVVVARTQPAPKRAEADDPLRLESVAIIPKLGTVFDRMSGPDVPLFLVLYPAPGAGPVQLTLEIRDGERVVGRCAPELPPLDADGRIAYFGRIAVGSLAPGRHEIRAIARESNSLSMRSALLESLPGPGTPPVGRAEAPASPEGAGPAAPPVFRVSLELVQVDAAVTDDRGQAVLGLTPDDFEITEDDHVRPVVQFSYVSVSGGPTEPEKAPVVPAVPQAPRPVGRTLVLLVDDINMSFEGIARTREALRRLVETQIEPSDQVALVFTSGGRGSVRGFTSDRHAMLGAVESLHWGRGAITAQGLPRTMGLDSFGAGGVFEDPNLRESVDRSRRLAEAVLLTVRESLRGLLQMPGRKALVLLAEGLHFSTSTPGEIPPENLGLWPLTELANRASTVVYAVDPRGVGAGLSGIPDPMRMEERRLLPEPKATGELGQRISTTLTPQDAAQAGLGDLSRGPGSQIPLIDLAHDTGGLFLPTNDMGASLRRVAEDQRSYYLLGYEPEVSAFETGARGARYHRVSVKAKRPGLHVRTRTGFYGVVDRPWSRPSTADPLRSALESPFNSEQLGMRVTALPDADSDRRPVVRVLLHVDGDDVRLAEREGGGKEARLEALVVAWNGAGEPVGETAGRFSVPVVGEGEARLRSEGVGYATTVAMPGEGSYYVRAVVRDRASGRLGAASAVADVPDLGRGGLVLSGLVLSSGGATIPDAGSGLLREVTPAARVFPRDSSVRYALRVFGARPDRATARPHLAVVARLLHEGQAVFTGPETPVDASSGGSTAAVRVSGTLQLPDGLEPGGYVLQVSLRDLLAPVSGGRATQSIDFELR